MANLKTCTLLIFFVTILKISLQQTQDLKLPKLGPLASNVSSVSGFSSGGALTFQFYLAHSNVLRGCGIFSGLMYECGLDANNEFTRLYQCIRASFNYTKVVNKIKKLSNDGLFDPLTNLQTRRHFISHGSGDPLVNIKEGQVITDFFRQIGTDATVLFNQTTGSHGYPTERCGLDCPTVFPPTINGCLKCGWSGAFESLNYIYGGGLSVPTDNTLNQCSPRDSTFSELRKFDQSEFFPPGSESKINMNKIGYIYIPPACQLNSSNCTLHVHIHGCGQEASSVFVGTDYIKCSGVMAVAQANNIIVIFPQANFGIRSVSALLQCWDFVGYTGPLYGTKNGTQIRAIKGMVDRVLGSK